MKPANHPDVVIFITHVWDDACTAQIVKLQRELGERYDIRVAGYIPDGSARPVVPAGILASFYGQAELALVQPADKPDISWPHFILLRFFQEFPDYGHYWMIEYDVRYTGHWGELFATLNDPGVAFYGIALQRRTSHPDWSHWAGFATGSDVVVVDHQIKCFTPLQRLSAGAITAIQTALGNGWRGHYEAVWPTAIAHARLRLEEIGAMGEFTPASRRGLHYTFTPLDPNGSPGSFVYRPTFQEHEISPSPPALWHPVKPADQQLPAMAPAQPAQRSLRRRILKRLSGGLISG